MALFFYSNHFDDTVGAKIAIVNVALNLNFKKRIKNKPGVYWGLGKL